MLGRRSIKTTQYYAKILDSKVSDDIKFLKSKLNDLHQTPKTNNDFQVNKNLGTYRSKVLQKKLSGGCLFNSRMGFLQFVLLRRYPGLLFKEPCKISWVIKPKFIPDFFYTFCIVV